MRAEIANKQTNKKTKLRNTLASYIGTHAFCKQEGRGGGSLFGTCAKRKVENVYLGGGGAMQDYFPGFRPFFFSL